MSCKERDKTTEKKKLYLYALVWLVSFSCTVHRIRQNLKERKDGIALDLTNGKSRDNKYNNMQTNFNSYNHVKQKIKEKYNNKKAKKTGYIDTSPTQSKYI